jgi:hypothetical protein
MLHILLCLYMHISSVYFKYFICFTHMLQVFHLDAAKVYLVLHMFQWRRWFVDSGLPQLPATAAGAPLWVIVRAPEASRGDYDPHGFPRQARQSRRVAACAWRSGGKQHGVHAVRHKNRRRGLPLRAARYPAF